MQVQITTGELKVHPALKDSYLLIINGWWGDMDVEHTTEHIFYNTQEGFYDLRAAYIAIKKFDAQSGALETYKQVNDSDTFTKEEKKVISKYIPTEEKILLGNIDLDVRYFDADGFERQVTVTFTE